VEEAKKYKQISKIPLILVGGFRSYERISQVLNDGIADFVSLGRPLINEPDLPLRWKSGVKHRAGCISCDRCRAAALSGEGLECALRFKMHIKD